MKKFLLSAVAATLVAAPIMAAAPADAAPRHQTTVIKHKANGRTVIKQRRVVENRPAYRTSYRTTYRPQVRTWARGQRFDYRYAPNYRVVNYRDYGRLYAPPRGYHWVQSGNDAVLVAITSGLIGAVIGGALN